MKDKPAGSACLTCPCRDARIAYPEANAGARVAVVGEAPTQTDLDAGKPFASQGGAWLGQHLVKLGLHRKDVHLTNAILCECGKDDQAAAAKACRRRLHEELASAAPRAILATGSIALKSILRPKSARIQDWRGSISAIQYHRDVKGVLHATDVTQEAAKGALPSGASYVLPVMHPYFVRRSPEWLPIFSEDIARLGRVLHSGWVSPEHQPGRQLLICRKDLAPLDALKDIEIAADVETPMDTRVMLAPLVCFVLSDTRTSVIVPWSRDLRGLQPWWQSPQDIAAKVTAFMRDRTAVTHNGFAFDYPIFARYGIHFGKKEDTLVAAHAYASHLPKRLSHVATTFLDIGPWKTYSHNDSMESMWNYCGADGLFTALVRKAQKELLS